MTDEQQLTDELFQRATVLDTDNNWDPTVLPYESGDTVRPKFDSVAATIMWHWSLDSGQDEDCGESQYGNGWHALFRSERAILHTGNGGFVTGWRIDDRADIDAVWAEIEAGAVYEDDVYEELT